MNKTTIGDAGVVLDLAGLRRCLRLCLVSARAQRQWVLRLLRIRCSCFKVFDSLPPQKHPQSQSQSPRAVVQHLTESTCTWDFDVRDVY